ncbi:SPOR domain-containing protein [Hansschlegelia sp. KR7-227]|uniref:SPOR domain-containing protein n=1 Tax=Hansschlegelia sp. KR7-227 TaxID=3400914 RepID=UPI003C0E5427
MQNQAVRRGAAAGGRGAAEPAYDEGYGQADDYALRGGHHYDPQPELEYDPRAYAPNPDEPYGYDEDGNPLFYDPDEGPALKSGRGGLLVVGAVLAVALLGGAGAVAYKMIGSGGLGGDVPLIKAETEPVKTTPEPKASDSSHQNKAIYDRVDANTPPKSKVVSREEEPVELPSAPSTASHSDGSRVILPGGPASAEPTAPSTMGSEPRRVKTVTIRPDSALTAINQPAPAAARTASNDPIGDAARTGEAPRGSEFDDGIMADGDAAPALRNSDPKPAPQRPSAPAQTAAARPATPAPAARPAAPAPAPAPRSDPQQVAAVAPRAATPAAAPAPRPAAGGFVVQVTSQRSEQDARTAYASLQRKYPQVLGSYQASIQTANVGDRGTYYRVRVGPFASSSDASTVCSNLRAAGGDCVVSRN